MAMALIWLLLFPVREPAGSGWRAGGVELLFEGLDIGLVKLAQLGNLHGQPVAANLVLLHRGLGRPSSGAARRTGGGLYVLGDSGGHAFVGGAPDAIAIQGRVDLFELPL